MCPAGNAGVEMTLAGGGGEGMEQLGLVNVEKLEGGEGFA